MSYEDEYDDYEAYDEGDAYADEYDEDAYDAEADEPRAQPRYARRRTPMVRRREENTLLSQGVDWAMGGSILAIVIITILYVLSPLDVIPDLLPVAGQADDLAAVLAGGGAVAVATLARYILRGVVATRSGRIGCLFVIVLAGIGAFVVFLGLLELFSRLF